MSGIRTNFGGWLNALESRWSLWNLIKGVFAMISAGLPAWAVNAMDVFDQYRPLSWVLAGFAGIAVWVVLNCLWQWAKRVSINAKYDARMLERGDRVNPLDMTFEGKRIFVSDFVLPSHRLIQGKTFINCDIIGPACLYFNSNNQATNIRFPIVDGIWLHPSAKFNSAILLYDCIFRRCSFQGITIFASAENYDGWKDNTNVNWISIPPTADHIAQRNRELNPQTNEQPDLAKVEEARDNTQGRAETK
jgi:hypothetical protein